MDESVLEKLAKGEQIDVLKILPIADAFFTKLNNDVVYTQHVKPIKEKVSALLYKEKYKEALQALDEWETIVPVGSYEVIKKDGKIYVHSNSFDCLHNINVSIYTPITPERYYSEVTDNLSALIWGELNSSEKMIVKDIAIRDFHRKLGFMSDPKTGDIDDENKAQSFPFLKKYPTTTAISELASYNIRVKNIPEKYYENDCTIVKFSFADKSTLKNIK